MPQLLRRGGATTAPADPALESGGRHKVLRRGGQTPEAPSRPFGPIEAVRALSGLSLGAPAATTRAIQTGVVRATQTPSFQQVAPALGAIVRRPLELARLPTGITSGLLPGAPVGNVARGLERQSQDIALAGLADELAMGAVGAGVRRGAQILRRGGQAVRSGLQTRGLVTPEVLPAEPTLRPVPTAPVADAPRMPATAYPLALRPTGSTLLRRGGQPPGPTTAPRTPAVIQIPPTAEQAVQQTLAPATTVPTKTVVAARVTKLTDELTAADKQLRAVERQRAKLQAVGRATTATDTQLQTLRQRYDALEQDLGDILTSDPEGIRQALLATEGTLPLDRMEKIATMIQQKAQRLLEGREALTQQATKRAITSSAREARLQTIREISRLFSEPQRVIRIAQEKGLTPAQLSRVAQLQRADAASKAPLTPADITQVGQRIQQIVPRNITDAQRQRLGAGQPTRLPGGPNQPPPVIPISRALVPGELRPQRDVPATFARATSEVDIQRAAQYVDGTALGPVNRRVVQPVIDADARAVAKAEAKRKEFAPLIKGIAPDSPTDGKLLRALEERLATGEALSPTEQQAVGRMQEFYRWAIEDQINPVLQSLGKAPITPRKNYAPHLPALNFLADLFGGLEAVPDELLAHPALRSVLETPIGQRDPQLPQALRDLPYIPRHQSAFFLKPRLGGPFRESAIAGLNAYIPLWAKITEVAPAVQAVKPLLQVMPPNFRVLAEQWLSEQVGKRAKADTLADTQALRLLSRIQRVTSSSLILGKVSTVLLQYSSLASTAARHGWLYTLRGTHRALRPEGRAFAERYSRELQQRMAVGTLIEGGNAATRIANAALEFTDQHMVAGAFLAAFEHYQHMPAAKFQQLAGVPPTFEHLIRMANIATEQTQASMRKALQSPVIRSQVLRALTSQLQTFNVNLRQQQFLDPQIMQMAQSRKEAALYVAKLDGNLIAMNLIYRFFGLRPPTDITDFIPIFDPFTGVVPIGTIGKAVESKGRFIPATALLATIAFKLMTDVREDGQLSPASMRDLSRLLWLVVPGGSQLSQTLDGLATVAAGGQRNRRDPTRFNYRVEQPADALKAVLLGPSATSGFQEYKARGFRPPPLTPAQKRRRQRLGRTRRAAPRAP